MSASFEPFVVHFLDDRGLTALGDTWRRGEELTVDADIYAKTVDTAGFSWLDLRDDEAAQIAKWGRPMFASGLASDELKRVAPASAATTPELRRSREAWNRLQDEWAREDRLAREGVRHRVESRTVRGPISPP